MNTRNLALIAIVLVGVTGLAIVGGCGKEEPVQEKLTFVNTKCPIMGNAIDPDNVPASLVRKFKDQNVAFCCGPCPGDWDKLSEEEKIAKLAAAK